MVDFNDPRLQKIVQRRMAQEQWGGLQGFYPEVNKFVQDEAKRGVQMGDYYLQKQMQDAKIQQMKFEQGMAEKRLGLAQQYLGLETQEMGLKGRNVDIAEQIQNQRQAQGAWEHNWFNKNISQKERELNLSTALGLGTSMWSAYEGARRANALEEDRIETRDFKRKLREKGLL